MLELGHDLAINSLPSKSKKDIVVRLVVATKDLAILYSHKFRKKAGQADKRVQFVW